MAGYRHCDQQPPTFIQVAVARHEPAEVHEEIVDEYRHIRHQSKDIRNLIDARYISNALTGLSGLVSTADSETAAS